MSTIVIEDRVCIPDGIDDLESFRRWATSDDYPEHGWFAYLDGSIWVDLSMEELFLHNLIKTEFTIAVGGLVKQERLGYFFSDRVLYTNVEANVSTEPDAVFVAFDSARSDRCRFLQRTPEVYVELEGAPDMVLEIASRSSARKDNVTLRELYHRAGVREYWLVDAHGSTPRFDILRHVADGFVAAEVREDWQASEVFGREFRLQRMLDPLGHPQFTLHVRP